MLGPRSDSDDDDTDDVVRVLLPDTRVCDRLLNCPRDMPHGTLRAPRNLHTLPDAQLELIQKTFAASRRALELAGQRRGSLAKETSGPAPEASPPAPARDRPQTPPRAPEAGGLAFEAGPLAQARDRSRTAPRAPEAGGLALKAGPLAQARDRSPSPPRPNEAAADHVLDEWHDAMKSRADPGFRWVRSVEQ